MVRLKKSQPSHNKGLLENVYFHSTPLILSSYNIKRSVLKAPTLSLRSQSSVRKEIKSTRYSQLCSWYLKALTLSLLLILNKEKKSKQCTCYSQPYFPPLICPAASKI